MTAFYMFGKIHFLGSIYILQLLRRYSLEIYVIHCVFKVGFRIVFINNVYISMLLNTIISTTLPMLFSVICKNLNIQGLFFKPVTYVMKLREGKIR